MNGRAGWCWWPGAVRQPHYWRPALVGFFGFGGGGGGVSIGIGFGNVGWVPLAPHEAWHPWYGRGWYGQGGYNRTLVNNTIIRNTNIYNVYRNARFNNGVAYTNVNSFGRGSQAFYAGERSPDPQCIAGSGTAAFDTGTIEPGIYESQSGVGWIELPAGSDSPVLRSFLGRSSSAGAVFRTAKSDGSIPAAYARLSPCVNGAAGTGRNIGRRTGIPARMRGQSADANSSFQQRAGQTPNTNTGVQPGQNSGWRSMGQNPSPAAPSPGVSGNSGSGWQRSPVNTPQSRVESRSNGNGYNRPASGDSGWRRFGAPDANSASRPWNAPRRSRTATTRDGTGLDIPAIAVPPLLPGLLRTRTAIQDPPAHLRLGSRAGTRARAKTIALGRPCEWNSPSCTIGRHTRLREHSNRAPKLRVRSPATVRHAPTARLRVSGTMMLLRERGSRPSPSSNGGGGHQRRR